MKSYDPNARDGKHEIKVTFQHWGYKGFVTYEVGGNCKGLDHLQIDADDFYDKKFKQNPIGFESLDEDWYRMILTNDEGEQLIDEDEFDYLARKIVAVEIIGFKEETNEL